MNKNIKEDVKKDIDNISKEDLIEIKAIINGKLIGKSFSSGGGKSSRDLTITGNKI